MNRLSSEVVEEMFPDGVCQTCDAAITKQVVGVGDGFRVGAIFVNHEPTCPALERIGEKRRRQ